MLSDRHLAIWGRARTSGLFVYGVKPPEFFVWKAMRTRCRNPNNEAFAHYGGRGIRICERWESFPAFFADVGPRPSPKHSLDRIDPNGNYEPGNVRWATQLEQVRNRRNTVRYVVNGRSVCLSELAQDAGIQRGTLRARIRAGWPIERAISTPARPMKRQRAS